MKWVFDKKQLDKYSVLTKLFELFIHLFMAKVKLIDNKNLRFSMKNISVIQYKIFLRS